MGLSRNKSKMKSAVPRPPDLGSTSGAKKYLHQVERQGTPEQVADARKKIAELHPDILLDRRR